MKNNEPIVWIPNKAGHNFSDAERFGRLIYLTEGTVNRYSANSMYREFSEQMEGASSEDYLLVSSLSILNSIASGILSYKFGLVNYLLFKNGVYLERSVNFSSLITREKGTNNG